MLPQGVSTNQSLDSYVNRAASKQNLSSGFPTKWYSNQPAKLQRIARKLKFRFSKSRYEKKVITVFYIICTQNFVFPSSQNFTACPPVPLKMAFVPLFPWNKWPCSPVPQNPGRASYMILFIKRIAKALIRLLICAGWFAPLLIVNPRARR